MHFLRCLSIRNACHLQLTFARSLVFVLLMSRSFDPHWKSQMKVVGRGILEIVFRLSSYTLPVVTESDTWVVLIKFHHYKFIIIRLSISIDYCIGVIDFICVFFFQIRHCIIWSINMFLFYFEKSESLSESMSKSPTAVIWMYTVEFKWRSK